MNIHSARRSQRERSSERKPRELTQRSTFTRLLRGELFVGGLCVASRIAAAAASLASCIVVARTLSADQAGVVFLFQTILLLSSTAIRCGIDHVIIREVAVAGSQDAAQKVLLDAVGIVAVLGTLGWVAAAGWECWLAAWIPFDPFVGFSVQAMSFTLVSSMVGVALCHCFACYFQGRHRHLFGSFLSVHVMPTSLLFAAAAVATQGGGDAWGVLHLQAAWLGILAAGCLAIGFVRATVPVRLNVDDCWRLVRTSSSMFRLTIISYLNNWLPQLILSAFAPPASIAVFSVSQRTGGLIPLVIQPVAAVASPRFAELGRGRHASDLRATLLRFNCVILAIGLPLLSILAVFGERLMSVFGPLADDSVTLFHIILVGQCTTVLVGTGGHLLMMTGRERRLQNATLVATVIGAILGMLWIPLHGAIGAAVCVTTNLVIYNGIVGWLLYDQWRSHDSKPNDSMHLTAPDAKKPSAPRHLPRNQAA